MANLYGGALDRPRLTLALDCIREITNASSATLHVFKRSDTRLRHQWQHSCSLTPHSAYSLALRDDENPRTLSIINPPSSTPCLLEDANLPNALRPQLRQWQEQLREQGMGHFVAVRVSLDEEHEVGLALHAKVDGSMITKGAIDLLFELMPHVRETVILTKSAESNIRRNAALAATFESVQSGWATVMNDGRILSMNNSARHLLSLAGDTDYLPTSLNVRLFKSENRRFVCWKIGDKHLHICVKPLGELRENLGSMGCVGETWLLTIRDMDEPLVMPSCEWAECYGLTKAELAVFRSTAMGNDINEIARGRTISIHTARTQLKSAMAKLGARRQSQLVRLAWTNPASWFN